MKYYYNGRYVKLIPEEFDCIENLEEFIDDLEHKGLSKSERVNMQKELLRLHLEGFIDEACMNPGVKQMINGANPLHVLKVITKTHYYYSVKFSNRCELKCAQRIYLESPVKKEIKRLY